MKHAIEMGSGVVIYVKTCLAIQNLIRWRSTQTYRQHDYHISLLLFVQNNEGRLKLILPLLSMSVRGGDHTDGG
jgi:hypothetical protein